MLLQINWSRRFAYATHGSIRKHSWHFLFFLLSLSLFPCITFEPSDWAEPKLPASYIPGTFWVQILPASFIPSSFPWTLICAIASVRSWAPGPTLVPGVFVNFVQSNISSLKWSLQTQPDQNLINSCCINCKLSVNTNSSLLRCNGHVILFYFAFSKNWGLKLYCIPKTNLPGSDLKVCVGGWQT